MPFPHDYGPGTDLASHAAIQAIRFALRERSQATGGGLYWPRQNKIAGAGTITSMTATTMTDSAAHWMVPNPNGGGGLVQRYYDYRVDAAPYFPRFYDLILDSDNPDPSKHVRVRPSTHDDNTATFATIQDSVTSNFLPSVASLVGKRYAWIKRGGLWWSDRWPRTPNDDEAWRGTGDAVTIVALTPSPSGPLPSMPLGATLSVGPATAPTGSYAILEGDAATVTIPWTAVALTGGARILSSTGTVLATVTIGALIDGLRNPLIQFKPSSMSGKELVAGSPVRRQAITGNSSTTIRFARQAYGVAGNFSVVRAGGRAWPGRLADEPFVWYGGATAAYATHFPSDSIVALDVSFVQMPLDRVTWSVSGGDPPTCTDVAHDAFDLDVWSEYDETCSEPDDCKSPDFYKSLRGCQIEVEDLCANFVDPTRNFTGDKSIPTLRFATLCALCNINPAGTLTATADGDGALTFSTGHASTYLYYALFDENGANAGDGLIGTSPTGTIALGGIAGKAYSLVLAFGWSRYPIREFAFAYPRSAFIPDIRTDDDGNRFIVDPPTEEYPGTWYDRPASTGYRSTSRLGFSEDSGGAFEAGVRARYVGTTWQDPAVDPPSSGPDDTIDAAYYASFWEGKFRKDLDPAYQASKSGKVAYAGATWVRTDPRWFNGPIGAGVLRTEAGTATGGSATTLVDTSKTVIDADSGLPRTSGYWDFPAGAGRYKGMILEVIRMVANDDGVSVQVVYKTPITEHLNFTLTILPVAAYVIPEIPATSTTARVPAIHVPALTVAAGDVYRIREPKYRRNWWKGRTVRITTPAGSVSERVVTYSDDDTLWWADGLAIDATGATFQLVELSVGSVYVWDGSKHVAPSLANNPRKLPLTNLSAHVDLKYGRFMKGDDVQPMLHELYLAIVALRKTKRGAGYASRANAATPESNHLVIPGTFALSGWASDATPTMQFWGGYAPATTFSGAVGNAYQEYYGYFYGTNHSFTPNEVSGTTPYTRTTYSVRATYATDGWEGGSFQNYTLDTAYAYPTIPGDIAFAIIPATIDFMAYAIIAPGDPDEGSIVTASSDGHTVTATAYKFSPQGTSGLIYRRWGLVATAVGSSASTIVGPRVGSINAVASVPDAIAPSVPPNNVQTAHNPNSGQSTIAGTAGFFIPDSTAIVTWAFEYVAI